MAQVFSSRASRFPIAASPPRSVAAPTRESHLANRKKDEPSFEDLLELAKQADARNGNHHRKRDPHKLARRTLALAPTQADAVKLGGKREGDVVTFGGEAQPRLVLKPSCVPKTHGWTVELTGRASREDRKRVLSASGGVGFGIIVRLPPILHVKRRQGLSTVGGTFPPRSR